MSTTVRILEGDSLAVLRTLPAASVHCCVTSPPYFGLRDYGIDGQIGLEASIEEYIARLVDVFREVRRVLRDDGTLWLNLGDSYAGSWGAQGRQGKTGELAGRTACAQRQIIAAAKKQSGTGSLKNEPGLKHKDLCMIPARVALALQADGWYLRSDIIWHKPNPMPESVTDRPTKAHEYVFLLSKSERYFYDAEAIKEDSVSDHASGNGFKRPQQISRGGRGSDERWVDIGGQRNRRSVWTISTKPYSEAHFATFPPELPELCIKAGCPAGGMVLDPFGGAGTTGMVAARLLRDAILIELNPRYCKMARRRIAHDGGMFVEIQEDVV